MNVLPRDTTVIIVSANGFRWGKDRPREMPKGGSALSDHRNPGVFIAYGPHISPSRGTRSISIYDLAPTVLTLLGLPQSTDMPGRTATWALRDLQPITSVRVVSYSEFVGDRPIATPAHVEAQQYQRELQAIGHLNDSTRKLTRFWKTSSRRRKRHLFRLRSGGRTRTTTTWASNCTARPTEGRDRCLQRAIEMNPSRPTPYLNLAMALFDKQQYTDAEEAFMQAVAKGLPNAENYFVDFAALYRQRDLTSRAIALLEKGKEVFPQSYAIAANLGSALLAANRYSEGVPELERALGLQPSSTSVLNNLGIFYAKKAITPARWTTGTVPCRLSRTSRRSARRWRRRGRACNLTLRSGVA